MGYFGSKATSGLCQALIALMPPHSVYIESHLGGGALMKRKPTGVRSIGIDRDAQALEAFACDYPVELVHGCAHAFLASVRSSRFWARIDGLRAHPSALYDEMLAGWRCR